jgi:hypothetical protein
MRNQAGNRLRQTRWRPLTSKRRCQAIFDKRKSPNTPFGTGEGLALTHKWHVVSLLGLWRFGWLEATKTNPGPDTGDWQIVVSSGPRAPRPPRTQSREDVAMKNYKIAAALFGSFVLGCWRRQRVRARHSAVLRSNRDRRQRPSWL